MNVRADDVWPGDTILNSFGHAEVHVRAVEFNGSSVYIETDSHVFYVDEWHGFYIRMGS